MGQTAYFQGHLMLFAGSGVPIVGTWFMVGGSYAWHIAMIHLYMVHIDSRASCHRDFFFLSWDKNPKCGHIAKGILPPKCP